MICTASKGACKPPPITHILHNRKLAYHDRVTHWVAFGDRVARYFPLYLPEVLGFLSCHFSLELQGGLGGLESQCHLSQIFQVVLVNQVHQEGLEVQVALWDPET